MESQLVDYLQSLANKKKTNSFLQKIEEQARKKKIPIMEKTSLHFLKQLIRIHKPKNILEIGTAIGYSAIQMYDAHKQSTITTIERNKEYYDTATNNIKKLSLEDKIDIVLGDAKDVLIDLTERKEKYDFIFIDAAKSQYKNFFTISEQLLNENGLIVTDNVLFRGYVYSSESVPKRFKNMVKKIKQFNDYIINHDSFYSEIIPIGDGVAISIRK